MPSSSFGYVLLSKKVLEQLSTSKMNKIKFQLRRWAKQTGTILVNAKLFSKDTTKNNTKKKSLFRLYFRWKYIYLFWSSKLLMLVKWKVSCKQKRNFVQVGTCLYLYLGYEESSLKEKLKIKTNMKSNLWMYFF